MGSVGNVYDNALCETFFATLECERLHRRRFRAHLVIFDFIVRLWKPELLPV
jgi:putative transposase